MVHSDDFKDRKVTFGDVARWSMSLWALTEAEVEEAVKNYDTRRRYDDGTYGLMTAQSTVFAIGTHVAENPDGSIDVRNVYGIYSE